MESAPTGYVPYRQAARDLGLSRPYVYARLPALGAIGAAVLRKNKSPGGGRPRWFVHLPTLALLLQIETHVPTLFANWLGQRLRDALLRELIGIGKTLGLPEGAASDVAPTENGKE